MRLGVLASGNLGLQCLKHLVKKDKPDFIACDKGSVGIVEFATTHNIQLFVGNPRKGRLSVALGDQQFDLILSINYLFLIEADVLDKTARAINFHGSLLPKYRGRTPHVWAIINNEKETGVTAHLIDEDCDTGNIVLQRKLPIGANDTGADILKAFSQLYPVMIDTILDKLRNGKLTDSPQNHDLATYYGKRTPDDGQIDWGWHKERIRNWVRAQSDPYPGAFSYLNGTKVIIDEVRVAEIGYSDEDNSNGEIIAIHNGKPVVKVPDGALELSRIRNEIELGLNDCLEYADR